MRAPVKELGGEIAEDFLSPKTAAYLQIGLFKAQAFQEQHQAGHPPVGGSPQMRERLAPKLLAGLEGGNGIGFFRGKPNIVPTQGTHLPAARRMITLTPAGMEARPAFRCLIGMSSLPASA